MTHIQVLHIEDDPVDWKIMRKLLSSSSHSYGLDHVDSLREGVELAKQKQYELFLLDLTLPDFRGSDALRFLRARFPSHPIIIVTGNIDQKQAEDFVYLGADDYLIKSDISSSMLWKSIVYAINKKKLEQDLQKQAIELKIATEMEKKANLSKSQFLAGVSHDLRNPISAISGYAELLADDPSISLEARDFVDQIKRCSGSLIHLVNDLLDLSKVEAGHVNVCIQETSLIDELKHIFEIHSLNAKQKNLSFTVRHSSPLPELVNIDAIRTRQVLDNLISNAIKFTDQGSIHVDVSIRSSSSQESFLEIEVTDTGLGIAPEAKDKIFEPFQQASMSIRAKFGGSGLGLALAKKIAQAMNGDIALKQSELGLGSTFYFRVPTGVNLNPKPSDLESNLHAQRHENIVRKNSGHTHLPSTSPSPE